MASINQLKNEAEQIQELINSCNTVLNQPLIPTGKFQKSVEQNLQRFGTRYLPRAANMFQKALNQGEIDRIIVGVAAAGAAIVGAAVLDVGTEAVSTLVAQNKAKKATEEYKQELIVKLQLIINRQTELITSMAGIQDKNSAKYRALEKEVQALKELIQRIMDSGFLPAT